jgi:hypothetical protein
VALLPDTIQKPAERRRTRRISVGFRCWITSGGCALYAPIRNINRDGLSVQGITPFKPGDEVSIRIEGHPQGADLVARSRVVWSKGQDEAEMGMGAEFVEITAGEQLLERILQDGDE